MDSYEDARNELLEIVQKLEAGTPTLEEALVLWERGTELAKICEEFLANATERLGEVE